MMRSILILTDFSEAAFRAAEYVCGLADSWQPGRMVLYHAYQTAIATSDLPVNSVVTNRKVHQEAMEALSLVSDRLKSILTRPVAIDIIAEDSFLPDTINERCREQNIDLIVMGAEDRSRIDRLLFGPTTARILKTSRCPVLVVPEHATRGRPVGTIVFATDLKDASALSGHRLYPWLDRLAAGLAVVHVGQAAVQENHQTDTRTASTDLHQLLDRYHPTYHYLGGEDVVKGILEFARDRGASLIIAVPKEHGILSSLFHQSVSEKLAYNSPVPLLFFPSE